MTNLNLTVTDIMDMPLSQIVRFAEKLDEQRTRDVAMAKAAATPTTK